MSKKVDAQALNGKRFGRLTVTCGERRNGVLGYHARCDCGSETFALRANVLSGRTRSCGIHCTLRSHDRGRPEYGPWYMMVYRCTNPKAPDYPRWGGRGIKVCERWLDFHAFLEDMGPRPPGTTLDRIDGRGHYEVGNVRWASTMEQALNKSTVVYLSFRGETLAITQWSRRLGVRTSTIRERLKRGWSADEALSRSPDSRYAWRRGKRGAHSS